MNTPVTEAELQAWADGRLAPPRRAAVDAYLALHPAEAARLQAYRDLNVALRNRYNPLLDAAVPAALAARPAASHLWSGWLAWPAWLARRRGYEDAADAAHGTGRPRAPRQAANDDNPFLPAAKAAALLLLVLGSGASGWLLRDAWPARDSAAVIADASGLTTAGVQRAAASLAQRAAVAHAVYTPEVRHPVEVGADQQAHLVAWLSKRLGTQLRPPQLGPLGYELEGGRLLPGQSGPVAQFMYHDGAGVRLTLYVSAEQNQNQETGFRYAQQGQLSVFYWIDGKFGYALSGALPKAVLGKIADAVYAQLEPAQ